MTRRSIRRSRSHPQKQALPEKACRCIPQKKEDFVMEGKMKVAVMLGTGQMGFEERDIPKAKDNEVLVKLEYVGICGSDLHYYETGAIGDYVVKPPFVLGHEPGGTVVEVGKNVKHLKAGDRVALEPGKTCGHCEFCRTGRYNLCPDVVFFATPPVDGVFQEYVAHEADLCFKLPDNVDTMEGALIEPLAVGFHAAIQGGAQAGQTAVVMGAGCIGLVTMMALKAMGASRVYVVDIMEKRLAKALELGADGVINGSRTDAVEEVRRLTGGKGCDLAVETAGTQTTTVQTIHMTKKGATVVLVGYSRTGEMTLPMSLALDKELTFKTVFRYRHIYPMAVDAVAAGKVNLKGIVTDVFDLDDAQKAMDYSVNNKADIVKAVIRI
jgi:L-iditol 2-dehydrogenase